MKLLKMYIFFMNYCNYNKYIENTKIQFNTHFTPLRI